MRLWPRTLRARLTLWYTAFFSGMLVVLGIGALVLLTFQRYPVFDKASGQRRQSQGAASG